MSVYHGLNFNGYHSSNIHGLLTKEFSKSYIENGALVLSHPGHVYEHEIALVWYERPESPRYFSALINAIS